MKFTFSWIKDHIETQASARELADLLTHIGLEVEKLDDPMERLKGFVVARVIEAKRHPNADRLQVCLVDAGGPEPIQVVCGAPNARSGMMGVFAPVGTWIPGKKMALQKGVIRGVESNGMLCSAMELELSDEHDGIIELPDGSPAGQLFAAFAGRDDPVFEINLTPNRPDAAGVAGVARDLAAAGAGRLTTAPAAPVAGAFPCPVKVTLEFPPEDRRLAPLFALRLLRGVSNGPSPEWMRRRLIAIGLRPINALVDVTNYLTFDRGRPLHVFDADKVRGDLVVRRARSGETLRALDGRTYSLTPDNVVIADASGVESIAGVIGGEATGCDERTTNVLLESALWDPENIARTGRSLGIMSDARYRFERGVDPAFCLPGAELATRLIVDLCGGEASDIVIAGEEPPTDRRIDFPWSEVARLTGLSLSPSEMAAILERLGFGVVRQATNADHVFVVAPSWRPDIEGKADVVEEIVRLAGVDRIEAAPFGREKVGVPSSTLTVLQRRARLARRALAARGLLETVTWSFISKGQAKLFGGGDPSLALANPISADLSDMRPSLAPGLLDAARRNVARGTRDLGLFEVGQVFFGDGEGDQKLAAAAIRRGMAKVSGAGRHWSGSPQAVDPFDAKSDVFALLETVGVSTSALTLATPGPPFLHPGRSATLKFGPRLAVGWFGEIHPRILETFDVGGPVVGFEIILDALPQPKTKPTKTRPRIELSELMPVERDFAFIVDRGVAAADLVRAVAAADRSLIADVEVFDVYEGAGVPDGRKSIAVAVTLQPHVKTLTESDIEAVTARIVAEVAKRVDGVLRS